MAEERGFPGETIPCSFSLSFTDLFHECMAIRSLGIGKRAQKLRPHAAQFFAKSTHFTIQFFDQNIGAHVARTISLENSIIKRRLQQVGTSRDIWRDALIVTSRVIFDR